MTDAEAAEPQGTYVLVPRLDQLAVSINEIADGLSFRQNRQMHWTSTAVLAGESMMIEAEGRSPELAAYALVLKCRKHQAEPVPTFSG